VQIPSLGLVGRALIPFVILPQSFLGVESTLTVDVTLATDPLPSQPYHSAPPILERGRTPVAEVASEVMQLCVVGIVPTKGRMKYVRKEINRSV
jgi:hypothetical protein